MKAEFVELPAFGRHRAEYLDDDEYRLLQIELMLNPEAGAVMPGTGGLRKIRFADSRRGKGKRGGLRVIYYWWSAGPQFWMFAIYDKDEATDLTAAERTALRSMIKAELDARRKR
ncbi:MAG: toxin [Candidatus Binatia bacterium]